ncbi:hypothetical protein CMO84_06065 [Candidatus Woesearchaeota archaeon]|nr:hypothetical protein [Candidatus Woesearchaeota archaeon]
MSLQVLGQRTRSLTLMGVLAAFLGLLLNFGSGPAQPTRPGLRVLLLDASMSVARGFSDHGRSVLTDLWEEANSAQALGLEVAVLKFARDTELLVPAGDPESLAERLLHPGRNPLAFDLSRGRDLETSLAAALALSLDLLQQEGRARGEVVLLGDGWATGNDPRPLLAKLLAAGHDFRLRMPQGAARINLQLTHVAGPVRVPEGRDLELRFTLAGTGPLTGNAIDARLILNVESTRGKEVIEVAIPWDGWLRGADRESGPQVYGQTVVTTLSALPPGPFKIEVRCQATGDLIGEDDHGLLSGVVGEGLLALLVEPSGGEIFDPAWVRALERQGYHAQPTELSSLDFQLASAALLVTANLPPGRLEPHSLAAFLERGGVHLLMGEGGVMAGVGSQPNASGPSRVLPLIPAEDDRGPRDVVLVVDGSGSMVGLPWQRVQRAVVRLAQSLLSSDGLVLHVFTTRLMEPLLSVAPGRESDLGKALDDLLSAHLPGGATDVAYALTELVKQRAEASRRSLCILISDGHSSQGGHPSLDLRDDLGDARADLAVIAVEGGLRRANEVALRRLLREGEELHVARDLVGLDDLLQEVVHAERQIGPFESTRIDSELNPQASPDQNSLRALQSFFERWGSQSAPGIVAAWRAQATPGAQVLIRAPSGEPLLASKDVGQGQVLVLATTPWGPTAPQWSGHPLLPDLLWSLTREADPPRVRLVSTAEGLRLVGDLVALARPLSVRWQLAEGPDSLGRRPSGKILGESLLVPRAGDPLGPLPVPWPEPVHSSGATMLCARVLDRAGHEVAQAWVASPLPPDLMSPSWPRLASAQGSQSTPQGVSHPLAALLLVLALACWTLAGWAQSRA